MGAWQDIDDVLGALCGIRDEMPDKEAFSVVTRAVWLVLDSTVRGIDKMEDKNG